MSDECPQPLPEPLASIAKIIYETGDHSVTDRNRPYNGQPQTDEGERGKTLVAGLTFRDVCDCYVLGFLMATGRSALAESGTATYNDVYEAAKVDPNFDPLAVMQNMSCEMERRMGIFPNLPPLPFLEDLE